jgi:hypothetical protein
MPANTIIKKGRNSTLSNSLTEWDKSRETLVNGISLRIALTTTDELEDEVLKFVTEKQNSAWEATPLVPTKVKCNTYPPEVREKMAEKRTIRKGWQMTRYISIDFRIEIFVHQC